MECESLWNLFWATGLPEAYVLVRRAQLVREPGERSA